MATDITQTEMGKEDTSQQTLLTTTKEIEFTSEQRYILGQVYQLILRWRSQRLQTVQVPEQEN